MEKLKLSRNNIPITVVDLDDIGGSEHVILGDYQRNLILRTKGSIRIQINNKFYDLNSESLSESSGGSIGSTSGLTVVTSLTSLTKTPSDGTFIYDKEYKGLHVVVDGVVVNTNGVGVTNSPYISYNAVQNLTEVEVKLANSNLANSYVNLLGFSSNLWEGKLAFVEDQQRHFYHLNGNTTPLYINTLSGGTIRGGLTVSDTAPLSDATKALLYIESLSDDPENTETLKNGYKGLFIGNSNFDVGLGIHASSVGTVAVTKGDLTLLDRNGLELLHSTTGELYLGFGHTDHITRVNNKLISDKIVTNDLRSKDSTQIYPYSYFSVLERNPGFLAAMEGDKWVVQSNHFITTSKETRNTIKYGGQTLLGEPFRILSLTNITDTEIFLITDLNRDLDVGDKILALAKSEAGIVKDVLIGTITALEIINGGDAMELELTNDTSNISNIGYSFIDAIKVNEANVLFDSRTNAIIGFNSLNGAISDYLTTVDVNTLVDAIDESELFFKPVTSSIHTLIGDLSSKTDETDFDLIGQGFYSNNAYIKGKANLSQLKLGTTATYENGALTLSLIGDDDSATFNSIILKAPNDSLWRVEVDDTGTLITTEVV